jgi:mono/diheme cytochrome c family protein
VTIFLACQQPGKNSPGSEYVPDMGHSIAYEANAYDYYYYNTWGTQDEYYKYAKPRVPVAGTIPRGFAGGNHPAKESFAYVPNGSVPFYYGASEEERLRAIEEVIDNPYPITDEGLDRGKELYDIFCGICHGDKGDGLGYLVRDDGGKYPVQPANLLLPEFVSASNGRYYHTLIHGRNKMGAYADKLNYEERWQVIHYVRALQAKELKLEYNQMVNTLNDVEQPAGAYYMVNVDHDDEDHDHDEHDDDMEGGHSHSDDHDNDSGH